MDIERIKVEAFMAYLEEQEEQGFAGSFQQWCQQRLVERFDQFFPPDEMFDDTPEEIVPRWVATVLRRLQEVGVT